MLTIQSCSGYHLGFSNKHKLYGVTNEDSIKYAVSDNIFIVFIQPQKKNSETRQMSEIQWVHHITVSSNLLCQSKYCVHIFLIYYNLICF